MKKQLLFCFFAFLLPPAFAQQTVGLFTKTQAEQDGYVLFPPMRSHNTYLIDKCGREVHTWTSAYDPGFSAYLTPEGVLLRPATLNNPYFVRGGSGGLIEEKDWNSNNIWSYTISSTQECQHHDVCYLPNGNILTIVWELKGAGEAVGMGRSPSKLSNSLWPDKIIELKPNGINSAVIVWEWHAWDHLVQDYDSTLPHFGVISDHPELLNINQTDGNDLDPDWLHVNSVAYNKDLDQIMLSSYYFNEFWVIDHSTTTQESQGHNGGKYGKGGDLLYRWGNPQAYGRGTANDQKMFRLHDAHWIAPGLPDSGKVIVFNNGENRPQGSYSTVEVIEPPVDPSGNYTLPKLAPYNPSTAFWEYKSAIPTDFYSILISGADRLKNGNTLICEGTKGNLFEVDNAGHIVWDYVNPVGLTGIATQGKVPVQNDIFRARQYAANYAGFKNRTLTPSGPIELKPLPNPCDNATPSGVGKTSAANAGFKAVNPFGNNISLQSTVDRKDARISLFNSMGMSCGQWRQDIHAGKATEIGVAQDLPSGVYLLQLVTGTEQAILKLNKD